MLAAQRAESNDSLPILELRAPADVAIRNLDKVLRAANTPPASHAQYETAAMTLTGVQARNTDTGRYMMTPDGMRPMEFSVGRVLSVR
jgi:hypothetical protein